MFFISVIGQSFPPDNNYTLKYIISKVLQKMVKSSTSDLHLHVESSCHNVNVNASILNVLMFLFLFMWKFKKKLLFQFIFKACALAFSYSNDDRWVIDQGQCSHCSQSHVIKELSVAFVSNRLWNSTWNKCFSDDTEGRQNRSMIPFQVDEVNMAVNSVWFQDQTYQRSSSFRFKCVGPRDNSSDI